jgi:hypothetical protein
MAAELRVALFEFPFPVRSNGGAFPALRERPEILKTSTALRIPITVALPGLGSSDKVGCSVVDSGIRVPQKVRHGWGMPEAASYEMTAILNQSRQSRPAGQKVSRGPSSVSVPSYGPGLSRALAKVTKYGIPQLQQQAPICRVRTIKRERQSKINWSGV